MGDPGSELTAASTSTGGAELDGFPGTGDGHGSAKRAGADAGLTLFRAMDPATFQAETAGLRSGDGSTLDCFLIDLRGGNDRDLRVCDPLRPSEWFDLPLAALASITPLGIWNADPSRLVVTLAFKPELASLGATLQRLAMRGGEGVSTAGAMPPDFDPDAAVASPGEAGFFNRAGGFEDEDPAAPRPGELNITADLESARILANVGSFGIPEGAETAAPEAAEAFPFLTMGLDISKARAFLQACMNSSPRVAYGLGAKVPFHGAAPGQQFKRVDCSGFIREAIWRATSPHLNFPDGSVVQHDWVRARNYKRSTPGSALNKDGAVRIAFLRPQDVSSGVGHVALIHNGQTLESHGGVGPNSRPWSNTGWQAKTFVYVLTPPTG